MKNMKHRDIQPAHEESVLDSFGHHLKNRGIAFRVIDRPDPPDAVVKLDDRSCWIEITDAFQSAEWARSVTSYAAEDRLHQPYKGGVAGETDQAACEKVMEVILKKYDKETMNNLWSAKGQGILLVGAYTPSATLEQIIEQGGEAILSEVRQRNQIFKSIYLYQNSVSGHTFSKLL